MDRQAYEKMGEPSKESWFRFHHLLAKFTSSKLFGQEFQDSVSKYSKTSPGQWSESKDSQLAGLPPLERFLVVPELLRRKKFYQSLKVGDVLRGKVIEKSSKGLLIKVTKVLSGKKRLLRDLNVQGICPVYELANSSTHLNDPMAAFDVGDEVRGGVLMVDIEHQIIELTLRRKQLQARCGIELGLIISDEESGTQSSSDEARFDDSYNYIDYLHKSTSFLNPASVDALKSRLDLSSGKPASFIQREKNYCFPAEEYGDRLKERQSHKWSMDMVATGVRMFKENRNSEASRCFDQALNLFPKNVEALVARGALKANQGNLKDSIKDFRAALEISPMHRNGRKYLAETLTSLGQRYEKDGKWKDASTCYKEVIELDPSYEDTVRRLRQINQLIREQTAASERKLSSSSHGSEKAAAKEVKSDKAVGYLKRLLQNEHKAHHTKKSKKSKKSRKKKKGKQKKKRKRKYSTSDSDTEATDSASDSDVTSTADSDDEWIEKPTGHRKEEKLPATSSSSHGVLKEQKVIANKMINKEKQTTAHGMRFGTTGHKSRPCEGSSSIDSSLKGKSKVHDKNSMGSPTLSSSPSLTSKLRHFSKDEMNLVAELLRSDAKK